MGYGQIMQNEKGLGSVPFILIRIDVQIIIRISSE